MHKEIEKAVLRINQAMEQNRKLYNDAHASYSDTGHERYYKKMERLENEYGELKNFLHTENTEVLPETVKELYKLRETLKNVKSAVGYLGANFPVCSEIIHLEELLMDVK